jgi:hypothetical protein
MLSFFRHIDELLRGRRTGEALLHEDRAALPLRVFVPAGLALGLAYGFFMGWYAIGLGKEWAIKQAVATTLKLPAVFLLTLVVTFPSLYVFNALVGCRLRFGTTLRLLVAAIVVNLAVAASLGPILGFFTLSTTSYPFMILLNVVLLGVGGSIGLGFLLRTLRRLAIAGSTDDLPPPPTPPEPEEPGALGTQPASAGAYAQALAHRQTIMQERVSAANVIFRIWVVLYGLVGMQMGWILRPFIGHPDMPFELLRSRYGNVFGGIWNALRRLFEM